MILETPLQELQQYETLLGRMQRQMEAELERRTSENRIDGYYPDKGPLRRGGSELHVLLGNRRWHLSTADQLRRSVPVTGVAISELNDDGWPYSQSFKQLVRNKKNSPK